MFTSPRSLVVGHEEGIHHLYQDPVQGLGEDYRGSCPSHDSFFQTRTMAARRYQAGAPHFRTRSRHLPSKNASPDQKNPIDTSIAQQRKTGAGSAWVMRRDSKASMETAI